MKGTLMEVLSKITTITFLIYVCSRGEENAYLDVDQVSLNRIANPITWKKDIPDLMRYLYDANGRLLYMLLTNGKIVELKYDKNGSLIKKAAL
ncbi:hypothetical protein MKY54_10195 [Paenibacillus sp. FSL P2-0121]|uniref:hypothetical protein n=1 Tax=Paenibacillus sp. FSL P2-0121 TaxID=2921626 RepID=UPI0030D5C528